MICQSILWLLHHLVGHPCLGVYAVLALHVLCGVQLRHGAGGGARTTLWRWVSCSTCIANVFYLTKNVIPGFCETRSYQEILRGWGSFQNFEVTFHVYLLPFLDLLIVVLVFMATWQQMVPRLNKDSWSWLDFIASRPGNALNIHKTDARNFMETI